MATNKIQSLFVFPEENPLFKIQELPSHFIKVMFDKDGFHFEGTGADLSKALDAFVADCNKAGKQAYERLWKTSVDQFLEALANKGFPI